MTKIKSAITAGFAVTVLFGSFAGEKKDINQQAFFMPMFSCSQERDMTVSENKSCSKEIIVLDDKNEDVEFCFKISEIFHKIFG